LLDLAQVSIYNSIYEESPVLLIDDIDAELDRGRIEALLSEIEGRAQTFVSTSRRAIANRYRDRASIHRVERGQAISEKSDKLQFVASPEGPNSETTTN
jgi:recombinational DNA repair ATPase RecF